MKPPMDETVETAPPSLEPHLADLAPSLAPELLAPEVCGQVSAAQVVPALVEGRVREGSESGDWPRDRSGRPAPHFDAKREPAEAECGDGSVLEAVDALAGSSAEWPRRAAGARTGPSFGVDLPFVR